MSRSSNPPVIHRQIHRAIFDRSQAPSHRTATSSSGCTALAVLAERKGAPDRIAPVTARRMSGGVRVRDRTLLDLDPVVAAARAGHDKWRADLLNVELLFQGAGIEVA